LRDNALTVPFGAPGPLAEGIVALLREPSRLVAMGRHSREIVGEFSWAAVAGRYLELYRAMLAPRRIGEG
jgi:glycosyltransferase involved in cell wall biosynthesis